MSYAPGTDENLEDLRKADLMGFTLPRKFGGLNMPTTLYTMMIEMVSRADASLQNLFGLAGHRRDDLPSSAARTRRSATCPASPPGR